MDQDTLPRDGDASPTMFDDVEIKHSDQEANSGNQVNNLINVLCECPWSVTLVLDVPGTPNDPVMWPRNLQIIIFPSFFES